MTRTPAQEKLYVELQEKALEHAWEWFSFHANQRMVMIRFYLTIAAAIGAGIGYLSQHQAPILLLLLSAFGLVSSFCFMRLDKRVSELAKIGERALKQQQSIIAQELQAEEFKICHLADAFRSADGKRNFAYPFTYGENFRILFICAIVMFGMIFAVNVRQNLPDCLFASSHTKTITPE